MTAQLLQQAMKKVLADMEKHKNDPQLHHGKQTLRQLMKHNTGVSNIEITDQNIKAFSATAKKYGIDFARFFAENSRKAAVTASASLPLKNTR